MKFYQVCDRELWGDYGHILFSGSAGERQEGMLELHRTGPFMPCITVPWGSSIVVTNPFRRLLEQSSLGPFQFRPVVKTHIVEYHWETWNLNDKAPKEYPESGEPEDYLQDRPHSEKTAEQLGDIWEVVLEENAKIEDAYKVGRWGHTVIVDESSWRGRHLFLGTRDRAWPSIIASEIGKQWLEENAQPWASFKDALTEPLPRKRYYGMDRHILDEPSPDRIREMVADLGKPRHNIVRLAHAGCHC